MAGHRRVTYRLKRVASLRFSLPSAFSNRARLFSKGNQPSDHPASTFGYVPAVFSATFASQMTDVMLTCDCGRDSIMRHRPLSRRRSAIDPKFDLGLADRNASFQSKRNIASARQRSWDFSTLRRFFPDLQGEEEFSSLFTARLPFSKRPPRQVYGRGIDRLQLLSHSSLVNRITDIHRGFRDSPCCKRIMSGLGWTASSFLPWVFPVPGLPDA